MPPKVLLHFSREPERVEEPPPLENLVQKVFQSAGWHERHVWADYKPTTKPENFGMGYAMRMRTNMQGLMTASVSMSDWICMEGQNLHTGHFSQTLSSNEPQSDSKDPSAQLLPWMLQLPLLRCTSALDQQNSNSPLQFFLFSPWKQSCFLSDTCKLLDQTWILQLCLLMEH